MHKNTGLPNGIFNYINRNIVNPQYTFSRVLDNEPTIEITELNSDDDHNLDSVSNSNKRNTKNKGSEINERDTDNEDNEDDCSRLYENIIDYDAIRSIYNEFYNNDCYNLNENDNCRGNIFKFIDDEQILESSSDDSYVDINFNKYGESGWNKNTNPFIEDIIYRDDDYSSNKNVWIYSVNNTSYLTEINELLQEIDGTDSDSSTVTNTENNKRTLNNKKPSRIPTPIPNYIPKLNLPLQPTLSTVIELIEPKPSNAKKTNGANAEVGNNKPINKLYDVQNCHPVPETENFKRIPLTAGTQKYKKIKSNHDIGEIKIKIEPSIVSNSWCSIIRRIPREPEILVTFKPHENHIHPVIEKIEDSENTPTRRSKKVHLDTKNIQQDNINSPQITKDVNKITNISEEIRDNEIEINPKACTDKLDTLSSTNSTTNRQTSYIDLFESPKSEKIADSSECYKLSFNLTNSDAQYQTTWLQKILKYCKCCSNKVDK